MISKQNSLFSAYGVLEENKNKMERRKKIIVIASAVIAVIAVIIIAIIVISNWFNKHELTFRDPIISPIVITKRLTPSEIASEVKTDLALSDKREADLSKVVNGVYGLESTYGKNDDCTKQNKFNGYGFHINSREHICYGSREEVKTLVIAWFNDKLNSGMSIDQALCFYNTGKHLDSCVYSSNYHLITGE